MTVELVVTTTIPTDWGEFECHGFVDAVGREHVALARGDLEGDVGAAREPERGIHPVPLVRLHSECFTGDVLGSRRCDCGDQLDRALGAIAAHGCGVLVYLRGHEGRGMGLVEKLRAYRLQDGGLDTVDANIELGFPVDGRDYSAGTEILRRLGVRRARLLSNNPAKLAALLDAGIDALAEPLVVEPGDRNRHYLDTKRERLGHTLPTF